MTIYLQNSDLVCRTMKYGKKVVGIVETCGDVWATYDDNHKPKCLNIEEKKSAIKLYI